MFRCILKISSAITLLLIIIAGCAKVSAPSGGPKDRIPPVVVKTEPVNGARFFNGNRITITFDEYVTLEKINEKFMVSPPLKKRPEVTIKGKSVVIEFEEELHDSTTYTFYFQDAIRDLNESNILDNYLFVFSTGAVIDSLSVTGNVYSAFTLNPPENAIVMLYRDTGFLNVTENLPDYISNADNNGYFSIANVREGKYQLYALNDKDNSKNFNLADEEFAFMDMPVEISAEKNYFPFVPDTTKIKQAKTAAPDTAVKRGEYKLYLFEPARKQRYLTSSPRPGPYQFLYTLSLPPDTLGFEFSIPGTDEKSYYIERSREKDSILVWITDSLLFSQPVITTLVKYPFTDTTGTVIHKEDTIPMRFLAPKIPARGKPRWEPLKISSGALGVLKPGQKVAFSATTPLRMPDTSRIRLYEVAGKEMKKFPYSFSADTSNSRRVFLSANLVPGNSYVLIADSAGFRNIYGEISDSTGYRFSSGKEENFGKLILYVKGFEGDRIIQILDGNEKLIRQVRLQADGKSEFPFLEKGKIRLRVIYDINGDGKWTTGDYLTRLQPEPVSFYFQELEVKEDWDLDQNWDISLKNVKKLKGPVSGTVRR